jgi:hypothetical protein
MDDVIENRHLYSPTPLRSRVLPLRFSSGFAIRF